MPSEVVDFCGTQKQSTSLALMSFYTRLLFGKECEPLQSMTLRRLVVHEGVSADTCTTLRGDGETSPPVVCTLDSGGSRHFCVPVISANPALNPLVCGCLSCLRHVSRFRDSRRFREGHLVANQRF